MFATINYEVNVMKFIRFIGLIAALALISFSAVMRADSSDQIQKGADIQIVSFKKSCKCFEILVVDEPASGPNFAYPKALVDALEYPNGLEGLKKDFKGLEKKTLRLRKDLSLLSGSEMEKFKLL